MYLAPRWLWSSIHFYKGFELLEKTYETCFERFKKFKKFRMEQKLDVSTRKQKPSSKINGKFLNEISIKNFCQELPSMILCLKLLSLGSVLSNTIGCLDRACAERYAISNLINE